KGACAGVAAWYLCDSMVEPLRMAGVECARYAIGADLAPAGPIPLGAGDWLLYVNYFGLCDGQVDRLLASYPAGQVVVDNSQAFYSAPRPCLATIYSPRKFFGVPDGGYLVTELALVPPAEQDGDSIDRCCHLLQRLAFDAESGYAQFAAAEQSLAGLPPKRMSSLTEKLLNAIDYEAAGSRRRENFAFLQQRLGNANRLPLAPQPDAEPLCYPFLPESPIRRGALQARRLYVPQYWPELLAENIPIPPFERGLADGLIPLPVDQRYGSAEMTELLQRLADAAAASI
ncbi:hypothetical protein, partial [Methylogaea oryzae]|uniref:hypothetical protein n=1 Tax=Methylogaea oryzae TaxID=1295382 RepID=UPI0006D0181F